MTAAEPKAESGLGQNDSLIRTENITKRFGSTVALNQVSLDLPKASIGLLGPNGSGKTTLLRLLLGLTSPTDGDLFVFGSNVRDEPLEIRRRIGYMPESDALATDVSAFDFVRHMAEISGLPTTEARLRTAEMLYLCGLDEERYRMIREFSTGMKQRVKLAQALVHDPDLVFLDEPTNGLDPGGHDEMLQLINRIHNDLGISVVVSSHVLEDIERVCEYVVMIDSGNLVGSGFLNDLMELRQEITVEIDDHLDAFSRALSDRGFNPRIENGVCTIVYDDDVAFDAIRDAAVDAGTAIRSLAARRTSLEEFYIDVVETNQEERARNSGESG